MQECFFQQLLVGWDAEPARQAGPALPAPLTIFQLILPSSPLRRCCSCLFHCHFTVRLLFTTELWRGLAGNISIGVPGAAKRTAGVGDTSSCVQWGWAGSLVTLTHTHPPPGEWGLPSFDARMSPCVFLTNFHLWCNFRSKSLWKQVLFVIRPLFFTLLCCCRGRRGKRPIKGR